MRIANNVEMLELDGSHGKLHPVLIWDETEAALIDTGLPGQFELVKEQIAKLGIVEKITKVFLTHQDVDHIGNAKLFKELGADVWAHKDEEPYISGKKTPVKLVGIDERSNDLDKGKKEFIERLKAAFPMLYVPVDNLLLDGDILPYFGGIEVIHTKGHTPGHMALLLRSSNIIIAGDACNLENGELIGASPQFTQNMDEAKRSFERLKEYKPTAIVCYHGGLFNP